MAGLRSLFISNSSRLLAAALAPVILAMLAITACGQSQTQLPASTAIPNTSASVPAPDVTAIPATASEIARVGEPAPDFVLDLFDGSKVRLSDFEGKVVVLNFWASWCPPCRREMPAFERTWQEYRDQGVVFVGVAVQDNEADSRAFAKKVGVTYPIGMDWNGRILRSYRPTSMPTTFLIDREGVVSRRIANYANEGMLKIFIKGQLDQ
ncbi:MAG: TlpA family protein disulfide reductase [Chloroflexi bacterium]|nr:TlpA family protein disulfide reductase [Chloroflexota bacterium]